MDLLMVRDRGTGRFLYTERLERRSGETSWAYVRRTVRREAHVRDRFDAAAVDVIIGYGAGSVEEFLRSYPEYRNAATDRDPRGRLDGRPKRGRPGTEEPDR